MVKEVTTSLHRKKRSSRAKDDVDNYYSLRWSCLLSRLILIDWFTHQPLYIHWYVDIQFFTCHVRNSFVQLQEKARHDFRFYDFHWWERVLFHLLPVTTIRYVHITKLEKISILIAWRIVIIITTYSFQTQTYTDLYMSHCC